MFLFSCVLISFAVMCSGEGDESGINFEDVDCSNIKESIYKNCYPDDLSLETMCSKPEKMKEASLCVQSHMLHCNPFSEDYLATDEEIVNQNEHLCSAKNLKSDCLRHYIFDIKKMVECFPGELAKLEDGGSKVCRNAKVGLACSLTEVRACDPVTADILTEGQTSRIQRLCERQDERQDDQPLNCSRISSYIQRHCYAGFESWEDMCSKPESMKKSTKCVSETVVQCNPYAKDYLQTDEEMSYTNKYLCSAKDLSQECMGLYIFDLQKLAACLPGELAKLDPSLSSMCKKAKAGQMCGVSKVRECDEHTADVMVKADAARIERLCQTSDVAEEEVNVQSDPHQEL